MCVITKTVILISAQFNILVHYSFMVQNQITVSLCLSLLWSSTVGYPSDSLASCFSQEPVFCVPKICYQLTVHHDVSLSCSQWEANNHQGSLPGRRCLRTASWLTQALMATAIQLWPSHSRLTDHRPLLPHSRNHTQHFHFSMPRPYVGVGVRLCSKP